MSKLINNGNATIIWHGITYNEFLRRYDQATASEAQSMSYVAALMLTGEVTEDEFHTAETVLRSIERRLIANYVGPIRLNRHGQPWGNQHPTLI